VESAGFIVNPEPRQRDDYSPRQVGAARRVLVDLGQVLAAFEDCLVVVGGWVPDLLLEQADEPHVGSIDVDLALDANKLADGRYADLLKLLLDSGRYKPGAKPFQLVVEVDLKDGAKPVEVEVEFLAPREVKLKKNRPKLLEGFRVLQADGCGTAFHAPVRLELPEPETPISTTSESSGMVTFIRVSLLPPKGGLLQISRHRNPIAGLQV
jgi:hypothetical protein